MTDTAFADWEVSILLPLGVIGSQLIRAETQLRHVSIKAVDVARSQGGTPVAGLIGAKLDHINEALDSIRGLVADLEADLRPKARASRDD